MNDSPLVRTPNGDDHPGDIAIGVLLIVVVALSLFGLAGLLAWDMTHPTVRTVERSRH